MSEDSFGDVCLQLFTQQTCAASPDLKETEQNNKKQNFFFL